MAEDWREKLGKAFEREVPEEKTEEKDWGKAYNEAAEKKPQLSREAPRRRRGFHLCENHADGDGAL